MSVHRPVRTHGPTRGPGVSGRSPMVLKVLRFVSLFLMALTLGLTFCHVMEIAGKLRLSGAEWLRRAALAAERSGVRVFPVVLAVLDLSGGDVPDQLRELERVAGALLPGDGHLDRLTAKRPTMA